MLSIGFIRENADAVKRSVKAKGEPLDLDAILEVDKRRRAFLADVEQLRNKRNEASKRVGEIKKEGGNASDIVSEMGKVGDDIKKIEEESFLAGLTEIIKAFLEKKTGKKVEIPVITESETKTSSSPPYKKPFQQRRQQRSGGPGFFSESPRKIAGPRPFQAEGPRF